MHSGVNVNAIVKNIVLWVGINQSIKYVANSFSLHGLYFFLKNTHKQNEFMNRSEYYKQL